MQMRRHGRYRLWFPVEVSGGETEAMAVNHNISAGGMLVAIAARLEADEKVTLKFKLPDDDEAEREVTGTILRIEPNSEDPDGTFRYLVAVVFDDVDEDLLPHLERLAIQLAEPT